nr:uncharacterized protein LOC123766866 isoform X2 [Procambarus clarkii]
MQTLLLLFQMGLVLLLLTQWTCGALWPLRTFIVRDMTLQTKTSLIETLTTTSVCRCKMRCLATVKCVSFSAEKVADQNFLCRLSANTPRGNKPISQQDAVYGFKLAKLSSYFDVTEEADGLIYFSPFNITQNDIPSARSFCKKFPGFRLAILRTDQQIQIGMKFSTWVSSWALRIDLNKTVSQLSWGDSTYYDYQLQNRIKAWGNSDDVSFSVNHDGIRVIDAHNTDQIILCQGNDKDEAW